jgi:hypothetical protein
LKYAEIDGVEYKFFSWFYAVVEMFETTVGRCGAIGFSEAP